MERHGRQFLFQIWHLMMMMILPCFSLSVSSVFCSTCTSVYLLTRSPPSSALWVAVSGKNVVDVQHLRISLVASQLISFFFLVLSVSVSVSVSLSLSLCLSVLSLSLSVSLSLSLSISLFLCQLLSYGIVYHSP